MPHTGRAAFVLVVLAQIVSIVAFQFDLNAGQEECFYYDVERITHKIFFSYEVISDDGSINLLVKSPADPSTGTASKEITNADQQRKLEKFGFLPKVVGLHSFCFSNPGSHAEMVGFTVHAEDEEYPDVAMKKHLSSLEQAVLELSDNMRTMQEHQRYMRSRDLMHRRTTESTHSRVFWWSTLEAIVLASMSMWQIWYLRRFFEVKRMI